MEERPRVTDFRLVLVDPNPEVVRGWRVEFEGERRATVMEGRFEDLGTFDCVVSPANSFGLMDGGVDLAITRFFGWDLMDRVQARILDEFLGEQPVGTSILVPTGHPDHPWLAHTPTMRVPMDIRGRDNAYLAMFAMLRAVHRFNASGPDRPIEVVACPGLGTATGRLSGPEGARQMGLAWRHYLDPPRTLSWPFARQRQTAIGC